MTLQEAKSEVAKKFGLGSTLVTGHKSAYWEEAMELYARSKWDEACYACADLACVDNIGTDGEAYILNNKPEFKP